MRHTSKALSAFWQSPLERLELFVNTTRSLMTWSTRLATAALGLGLALAAHAEPVEGEVKKVDQEAAKITLKPGGFVLLTSPGAAGYALSGTNKMLRLETTSGSVKSDIVVFGRQTP